nr:F-box only protein 8-like [Ipomoea batatas]
MEDERQMEASSASISCITCLPREILVKILSGLPAKCAVRFRCSCKFFYSYIPEPRFAFTIRFVLPTNNEYPASKLYSVSYSEDDDESVQKLDARGLIWSTGSNCAPDGKMCLLRNEIMGLIGALFDLSTGRCIYLPPNSNYPAMYFGISNSNIIGNGDFVLTRNSSIGKCPIAVLGFDSISERYKVFASEVFYNGEQVFWKQHWVLTLGVDESWREIRSTIFIGLTDAAVHIHGIIYFIPQVTERESSLKMIVAMDVARERIIRFIPFPSGYHQSRQRVREWVPWIKLNGRLAFIDIIIPASEDPHPHPDLAESKIEIWTLKIRSAVEEEWEKQTVLLPLEESKVIGRATSMGFTSNSMGEIVILLSSKTIISLLILIYSFRRDVWRRIEISRVSKYSSSSYVSDMEVVVHVDDEIVASF